MNAVSKLDEPAILELAGEVLRIRRGDECARLAANMSFG
jgi:hypothetical protein